MTVSSDEIQPEFGHGLRARIVKAAEADGPDAERDAEDEARIGESARENDEGSSATET